MKKKHGHYCRICGSTKPNEKFSGKGHKNHICKQCSLRPKKERDTVLQKDEIYNFLHQSHISKKNITRLHTLVKSPEKEIVKLAEIVLDVAMVKPYKKKRLKFLAKEHKELLERLDETGLILSHHF